MNSLTRSLLSAYRVNTRVFTSASPSSLCRTRFAVIDGALSRRTLDAPCIGQRGFCQASILSQQRSIKSVQHRKPTPKADPSKKLFIGNIPFSATTGDLYEVFSDFAGFRKISFPPNPDGQHRGYVFLDFHSVEDAEAARSSIRDSNLEVGSRPVIVNFANPVTQSLPRPKPSNSLHVAEIVNLHEQRLTDAFSAFEGFKQFRLIRDNQGAQKGYGFADFEDANFAGKALKAMHGYSIIQGGHPLSVMYARNRSAKRFSETQGQEPSKQEDDVKEERPTGV